MNASPESIVKTSEKNQDEFKLIEHLTMFYREVFSSFNESKKNILIENLSMTDALLQPIWCNCLFKSKGKHYFCLIGLKADLDIYGICIIRMVI